MKIGFACKISELNSRGEVESIPHLNFKTTTVSWLNRQHRDTAVAKLWDLMKHNIEAAKNAINYVGKLENHLRMFRLGSDILPVYTEPNWSWFWRLPDVRSYCERELERVGNLARSLNVRLSMHPGQFCCLASDNPEIVARSIAEFEYHADVARWLGYGKSFQDFKINVHISGRQGPNGVRVAYGKLTPEARNTITIENEENTHGLAECLEISDIIPIVMDIHHNWCREGNYIQPNDLQVQQVIESWRGLRPTMHYSVSREDYLVGFPRDVLLNYTDLLNTGYKKQKLRAHSDYMWNTAVNNWALGFLPQFDIMVESKAKNLASFKLAKHAQNLGII